MAGVAKIGFCRQCPGYSGVLIEFFLGYLYAVHGNLSRQERPYATAYRPFSIMEGYILMPSEIKNPITIAGCLQASNG